MPVTVGRRGVLAAGTGAAVGLLVPARSARASSRPVEFTLNAETLDGGEQITSITLRTAGLGLTRPPSTGAFTVHVRAVTPLPGLATAGEYDLDRTVTATRLDRRGNVVLDLDHAEGQIGGATLGYVIGRGRNVRFDLTCTVTPNGPVGKSLTGARFVQGALRNPEVDRFAHRVSASGLKYRHYDPGARRRPLIVWLHGGGEGASRPDGYYDNETTLRANRGALGFATDEAQRIFGGAHVVVPQSTSYWMEDGPRFAPLIREIVESVAREHDVDRRRISVAGCSNGGYMSLKMTTAHPDLFAASVPVCGVVAGSPPLIPDADLAAIETPTWLVASLDDPTVDPRANTVHAAGLIPGARSTLYDQVVRDGYRFNGHWSWIYLGRNDPQVGGEHVWQWMARQRR